MMNKIISSPIFYMGNKKRLIQKGLIDLFPKNIDTFIDLFGGSGVVSLNVNANQYVLNDLNNEVGLLYLYFNENNPNKIILDIKENILKYKLPTFSTDARKYTGDRSKYKNRYNKLREDYNKTRSPLLLYMLNIFSNSHNIRVNSKGDFNMPFGNGYFTEDISNIILNNNFNKFKKFYKKDFRNIKIDKLKMNDFVYLDPPYLNTTATYNENNGWIIKDDFDLFNMCEKLNENNIKWGMSNVFENKGKVNGHLIDWCNKNNWIVYEFNSHTYSACGKGNSNAKEVYICNYEIER